MTAKASILIDEYFSIDDKTGAVSDRQRAIASELLEDLKDTMSSFELTEFPEELMVDYSSPAAMRESLGITYTARRELTAAYNRTKFAHRLFSRESSVSIVRDGSGIRFIEEDTPFPIAVTVPGWIACSSPEDFANSMNKKITAARAEAEVGS